jgi:hemerythrin
MAISFTTDLETGVGKIDEQHKELIKRISDVVSTGAASAEKAETDKIIQFLGDYIIEHFTDEEKLQKDSGYPKYEWHKGLHEEYVGNFNRLKEEYAKNGPSISFSMQLNKSIIDWIVRHIRTVDKELGAFINGKVTL